MKKIFSFFIALFVILIYSNAQNTSPYWSLAGNNNASSSSKLGTTNNISLRFYTNNVQRMIINSAAGYVGIGTPSPVNILTVQSSGGTPSAKWLNGLNDPVFVGFANDMSSEFVLAGASNVSAERAVFQGRRSRGTLTSPAVVVNNDYITSLLASAYDGSAFQNPALIGFFVDGTPSSGSVPTRVSLVTGSNAGNRTERLKVGSTGNFNFNNGQVYLDHSTGFLGVGTVSPSYQLHVTSSGTAIYGNTTGNGNAVYGFGGSAGIGVRGLSDYIAIYGDGDTYGVQGFSGAGSGVYGQSGSGYGVRGYSNDSYGGYFQSFSNYAVYGQGYNGVYGQGQVGVYGFSNNGGGDGVHGFAYGENGYGVYGYSATSLGVYGVTSNTNSYAGYFAGKVFSSGGYTSSDKKLKQDITAVTNALEIILKLQPKTYKFRQDGNYKLMNLPLGKHYGLIAQDVESILPDLVNDSKFDTKMVHPNVKETTNKSQAAAIQSTLSSNETIEFKALNYTELIPILIKGMQEQQTQIEKLNANNAVLQKEVDELKSLISKNSETRVASSGYLKQNSPNPFSGSSIISYYIPENVSNAQIKVTDINGRLIKIFNPAKGDGQINIEGGELAAGTYNYSLYINNKTVDTKQMVLLK
jgi:hypothetical protein